MKNAVWFALFALVAALTVATAGRYQPEAPVEVAARR